MASAIPGVAGAIGKGVQSKAGTAVTVTATAGNDRKLEKILVDGVTIEDNSFTVTGNHTVTAQFSPLAVKITAQPQSVAVGEGEKAVVTVGAEGEGLVYKWYYKNKSSSKFLLTDSFKTETYSVAMSDARDGRQLYCVITDRYGNSVTTDTVTISKI